MSAHLSHHDFSALLRTGSVPAGKRKPGVFGAIGGAVAYVFSGIAAFNQRRAMMNELQNLGDRELADIGIARADIPKVFDAGFASRINTTRRTGGVSGQAASV